LRFVVRQRANGAFLEEARVIAGLVVAGTSPAMRNRQRLLPFYGTLIEVLTRYSLFFDPVGISVMVSTRRSLMERFTVTVAWRVACLGQYA